MFARFVARRYLFSRKSRSVVNLIAALSVVSVAMPVAAMIILLSVFNGFETLVKSMCSTFDAPLTVSPIRGQTFALDAIDTAAVHSIAGVGSLSYVLEQSALVERDGRQATATIRGADDSYVSVFPVITNAIESGEYQVRLGDLDRLVLGRTMAYMLGIRSLSESDVTLYAPRRNSFSTLLPSEGYIKRTVPVSGVYVLDLDTERQYILTSLRFAQELFSYPDRVSALLIGTNGDASRLRDEVQRIVGADFKVSTAYELRSSFYAIMNYEKWAIFFFSLLVLVIASFSVVGALAMLITDKRDDISTLRALGASTRLVRSLFRWEGWFVSGFGAVVGLVLGVGFSLAQQYFGFIEIPAETFLTKSYPVEFRLLDLLAVVVAFSTVTACVSWFTVRNMIQKERI